MVSKTNALVSYEGLRRTKAVDHLEGIQELINMTALVVQTLDSAVQGINHHPVDKYYWLERDLSNG